MQRDDWRRQLRHDGYATQPRLREHNDECDAGGNQSPSRGFFSLAECEKRHNEHRRYKQPHNRRRQPVGVLDEDVVLEWRDDAAVAERPVRAGKAGARDTNKAAQADEKDGRDRRSQRQPQQGIAIARGGIVVHGGHYVAVLCGAGFGRSS